LPIGVHASSLISIAGKYDCDSSKKMEMRRRIVYISRNYRNITSAGNKAKSDNEKTVEAMGGINLGLKRSYYKNSVLTFLLNLIGIMRYCFNVRRNDVLFLQYPVKKYFRFICWVAHRRGAKVVSLIHDLGSFRRKRLTVAQEMNRLRCSDYIIATNHIMAEWLREREIGRPVGTLGFHDYLTDARNEKNRLRQNEEAIKIVYAGNLSHRKNAFLLDVDNIGDKFEFHIYGKVDCLQEISGRKNLILHDFLPSDDFIKNVEGDFGLVWDGDKTTTCTGDFGEYLRLNTPHKASFYIRAGLPLIVWKESAIAELVNYYGIGICIGSLGDLETTLRDLSDKQMMEMRQNVAKMSEKLQEGYSLRLALSAAVGKICGDMIQKPGVKPLRGIKPSLSLS